MQEKRFEVVLVAKHYNDSKRQERKMVPKDLFVMKVLHIYIYLLEKVYYHAAITLQHCIQKISVSVTLLNWVKATNKLVNLKRGISSKKYYIKVPTIKELRSIAIILIRLFFRVAFYIKIL